MVNVLKFQTSKKKYTLNLFSLLTIQAKVGWLCWGLTSQSTIFQSCRDGAIASWVINQYFRGVKCLAQGHNTAAVGLEPRTSRSGVRHSTTEPPRSPFKQREVASLFKTGYFPHRMVGIFLCEIKILLFEFLEHLPYSKFLSVWIWYFKWKKLIWTCCSWLIKPVLFANVFYLQ